MPEDESDDSFDDVADDETDAEPPRPSFLASLFTPKSSGRISDPELRERMRTLDPQERRFGFIGVPLALLVSLLTLRKITTTISVGPPSKIGRPCKTGSSLNHALKLCEVTVTGHAADYQLIFALGLVLSAVLLFGTYRSIRTLVIFTTLFIGLFAGVPGILFLFFGGWLVLRSWRLQRYGAKDGATARRVAMERSAEKRDQRRARASGATAGGAKAGPSGKPVIPPSKRYTPKAKPRRK